MENVLCQGSIGTGFGGRGQGRRSSVLTTLIDSGRQEGSGLVKDRADIQDRTGGGSGVAASRREVSDASPTQHPAQAGTVLTCPPSQPVTLLCIGVDEPLAMSLKQNSARS